MTNHIQVLIVDDNQIVRRKINRILSTLNCIVSEAEDGEQALALIKETRFDVIFLDIRLPFGVSGLEVFKEAKAIQKENLGKVIILTGSVENDTQTKAHELGAFAFLDKAPFDRNIIIETFNKALLKVED